MSNDDNKEASGLNAKTLMKNGKTAAAKAAALHASYKTARKTLKTAADTFCHTWAVCEDYSGNTYHAAKSVAADHIFKAPGRRRRDSERSGESVDPIGGKEWTHLSIPGVSHFVQVKKTDYAELTFRAPRVRDLNALRAYIAKVESEQVHVADFEFDPEDYTPQTNLLAWTEHGWDHRKTRSSRSFNSVFLPAELQADIEADLKGFTDSRDRLTRLELPWRRGYLLSGPPGTGKTSLSLAIAGSLGFNLASLSLTDIKSDGDLRQAVSQLRKRTVLVIEDIDAYSVSHDRDHNTARDGALSLSGLLNSLDGFETPDGLVTIATTNHVEHLDPALIRSGRLDRTFHLGHIEARELERLYAWFYEVKAPESAPDTIGVAGISPAEVTEQFKQHLNDAQGGWDAVLSLVEQRLGSMAKVEVAA